MKHVRTHYKEQNRRKNSHMQCYRAGARRSRSTGMALAPADIQYCTVLQQIGQLLNLN